MQTFVVYIIKIGRDDLDMKKILGLLILIMLSTSTMVFAVGATKTANSVTLNKMKVTIGQVKRESVVGDRTADNVGKANGDYFADGSKILKTSDYEYIVIPIKVENKSNKAMTFAPTNSINYNDMGFYAKMADGYKLEPIIAGDELTKQVPSNYTFSSDIRILHKKTLTVNKFTLYYLLVDYGDALNNYISEAYKIGNDKKLASKFMKKYADSYLAKPAAFNITLK